MQKWLSKPDALRHASAIGGPVHFYYHNKLWESYDRSRIGSVSLVELYKQRALQLRESYDYLVLHYSGGADSHNILRTFIDNGIKLDEVFVKWSMRPKAKGWYTPSLDTSASNSLSEWDYAIKPTLDWLAKNHPSVRITISDFLDGIDSADSSINAISQKIEHIPFKRGAFGSFVQRYTDSNERHLLAAHAGKNRTGHIFGIEKPQLSINGNAVYTHFSDTGFETLVLEHDELSACAEAFYWTPDMPLLALTQAKVAAERILSIDQNSLFGTHEDLPLAVINARLSAQSSIMKSVLYPTTWDNRFQVEKPNLARSDWWGWLYEIPELTAVKTKFRKMNTQFMQGINERFLIHSDSTSYFAPISAKPVYVMDLT